MASSTSSTKDLVIFTVGYGWKRNKKGLIPMHVIDYVKKDEYNSYTPGSLETALSTKGLAWQIYVEDVAWVKKEGLTNTGRKRYKIKKV